MRNIIKKSLIIALLYYAVAISSCLDKQCNCAPVTNRKFNYTELRTTNLVFNFKGDTTFSNTPTTTDTISTGQFGFRMHLDYKTIAALRQTGLINSAYACDCVTPQFFIVDSVTSISVITLKNLDAAHPAGSEVKDYFKALQQQYSPHSILYYDGLQTGNYNSPAHAGMTGLDQIDFYLKTAVPSNQKVAFEITFSFASGNKLTAQTQAIFLK